MKMITYLPSVLFLLAVAASAQDALQPTKQVWTPGCDNFSEPLETHSSVPAAISLVAELAPFVPWISSPPGRLEREQPSLCHKRPGIDYAATEDLQMPLDSRLSI